MASVRPIVASLFTAVLLSASLAQAQPAPAGSPDELILHAYALKHRRAVDAISLVSPLLSRRGTVELQPGTNTVVIRDTMASLSRIIPVLRSYDHPARPLTLEIYIVRASRSVVSPPLPHSDLPEALTRRLRALLAYDIFEVQAQAQLVALEGQAVTYGLAQDYEVSFRLGTLIGNQQIRLSNFQIVRRGDRRPAPAPLIHTNLNLRLDQTTSLGLARSESSPEALMVVLNLRNGPVARRVPEAENR
jgi:hypothetical protein